MLAFSLVALSMERGITFLVGVAVFDWQGTGGIVVPRVFSPMVAPTGR
jgi:hypothetical protein